MTCARPLPWAARRTCGPRSSVALCYSDCNIVDTVGIALKGVQHHACTRRTGQCMLEPAASHINIFNTRFRSVSLRVAVPQFFQSLRCSKQRHPVKAAATGCAVVNSSPTGTPTCTLSFCHLICALQSTRRHYVSKAVALRGRLCIGADKCSHRLQIPVLVFAYSRRLQGQAEPNFANMRTPNKKKSKKKAKAQPEQVRVFA